MMKMYKTCFAAMAKNDKATTILKHFITQDAYNRLSALDIPTIVAISNSNEIPISPNPVSFIASDGYVLHGQYWSHNTNKALGAVLICCATGLKGSYYRNYAQYLSTQGLNVLVYDYRGIGASRPSDMRSLTATMRDWGIYDTEAALLKIIDLNPSTPLYSVCNSVGKLVANITSEYYDYYCSN